MIASPIPARVAAALSTEQFGAEFFDRARPVVLRGLGADWPALRCADGSVVVGDQQHKASGKGQLAPAGTSLVWRTLTQEGPVNDQPIKLSE